MFLMRNVGGFLPRNYVQSRGSSGAPGVLDPVAEVTNSPWWASCICHDLEFMFASAPLAIIRWGVSIVISVQIRLVARALFNYDYANHFLFSLVVFSVPVRVVCGSCALWFCFCVFDDIAAFWCSCNGCRVGSFTCSVYQPSSRRAGLSRLCCSFVFGELPNSCISTCSARGFLSLRSG